MVPRVLEGDNDSRDDEIALVTESWADTFAMQVVGGANYITAEKATSPDFDHSMGFCNGTPCMEFNYQGGNDYPTADTLPSGKREFLQELAKVESTLHDAFDLGDGSRRLTNMPSNGDVWLADAAGILRFASASYVAVADELVALDGSGWKRWVDGWLERGGHPSRSEYFGGLSDAMREQQATWCDRCSVFAVHEYRPLDPISGGPSGDPTLYAAGGFADQFTRWQICKDDSQISTWLDENPPDVHLNLDSSCQPCGQLEFSSGGVCTACPLQEVPRGDHCEPCPLGAVPDPFSNECIGCDSNEISVGGECVQCPLGEAAARATNSCVLCPADAIVDLASLTGCGSVQLTTTTFQGETDICPLDYWIEVQNVQAAVENECDVVSILIEPTNVTEQNPCETRTGTLTVYDAQSALSLLHSSFGSGTWATETICGVTGCIDRPNCTYPTRYVISESQLSTGIDTVRALVAAEGPTGAGGRSPLPADVMIALDDVGDIR